MLRRISLSSLSKATQAAVRKELQGRISASKTVRIDPYFLQTYEETEAWLNKAGIKDFEIDLETLEVSAKDVGISRQNLTKIPVQFSIVKRSFNCGGNKLTSLKGAPHYVGGAFRCTVNSLTSLEYSPKEVGSYECLFNNELTSLKGSPVRFKGEFDVSHNAKLLTLAGVSKATGITKFIIGPRIREQYTDKQIRALGLQCESIEKARTDFDPKDEDSRRTPLYTKTPKNGISVEDELDLEEELNFILQEVLLEGTKDFYKLNKSGKLLRVDTSKFKTFIATIFDPVHDSSILKYFLKDPMGSLNNAMDPLIEEAEEEAEESGRLTWPNAMRFLALDWTGFIIPELTKAAKTKLKQLSV